MFLTDILNEIKELAYIADIETYEILFVNASLKNYFGVGDSKGKKCYELLHGAASPCPFCTTAKLKKGEIYTWDFFNPVIQKQGKLKDMLIDFEGHKARLEIIEDITEEQLKNEQLTRVLSMERVVMNCVKNLYKSNNPKSSISYILHQLGTLLKADRAYIFEIKGEVMNNTYEWCSEGVEPQIDFCQNMDVNLLGLWRAYFDNGKSAIISDIIELQAEFPESYEALAVQNIKSMVVSPLIIKNHLEGYIGVDNPDPNELEHFTVLESLSYFLGISLDRMRLNESLLQTSYHDILTGLYNRNKFSEDVDAYSCCKGTSMGIVYMDINGLKHINDNYGHLYGDQILLEGANILRGVFGEKNIYRVGGDEFVTLIKDIDQETLAEKVSELKKHFLLSMDCKGAIGSVWTENCEFLQKKISEADEFMYKDKMQYYHSNPASKRYRYYNDDTLKLAQKSVLLEAIANNQFEVYLQPKVDFQNRGLIGAEALIRYHNDKGELISPDQFIPSMEEAKTICYIDLFVFETICGLIQKWLKNGCKVSPISVNCSRHTLMLPDFLTQVDNIWKKYHFPKHLIEIEIIESSENIGNDSLIEIMEQIKQAGYPVCIDDFGVKYSNLALFANASLDILKLDKSMISDILTNRKSQLLISSLTHICHDLELQLIVEGVETEEQFEILRNLKCDGLQGYLISRPIPIPEYEIRFLKNL